MRRASSVDAVSRRRRAKVLLGAAVTVLLLPGCGISEAELEAAWQDGYRQGMIWCKRQDQRALPEAPEPLLARWQAGWQEAVKRQCLMAGRSAGFLD